MCIKNRVKTQIKMFYWKSGGGSEAMDGDMSKAEILRGIVTEKLSTAAQEILAVVERTVAGYEAEASGFRREIARQKRQLELLLQPRVKLERKAVMRDDEGQEVVVVSEGEEEEQQPGVEDARSLDFLWYDDFDEDDDFGDEEQRTSMQMTTNSRRGRDDLKDPDFRINSRLISPKARSERRRPGRPRISDASDHLDLRIYILEDSQTDVLSKWVYKKSPMQEVRCPRGLQETHFLDLLRSTFPQLAGQKPFEVFTSDKTKRLQPLRVTTLTPEEIYRSIRLSGSGHSALYIRLKNDEDPSSSSDNFQRPDVSPSSCATTSADQSISRSSTPRDSSDRKRRGRPRVGEEPTHHVLRVCVLEDSHADTLSRDVLLRSSIRELTCPRGQQEADFLHLLRSTFPQLADAHRPVSVFKADRSRRLQRLRLTTLTPDDICRSMKPARADKTLLYVRLKSGHDDDDDDEVEEVHKEDDETANDCAADDVIVQTGDEAALSSRGADGDASDFLPQEPEDVEVEDEDTAESHSGVKDEALDEALDDDDWKPDPELRSSRERRQRGRRGRGLKAKVIVSSKMPCRVCGVSYRILGSLIKHAWSHVDEPACVCGVCGERFQSVDELKAHIRSYQKTHDCSYCGKSFLTVTGLHCHTTLHTGNRPYTCDVCDKTFAYMSSLSIHRWVHVADKPHKCDFCPKAFGLKAQLRAHRKVHLGRDKYNCNVCGKALYDLRSLTRHKTTHSGERRYGCEVCGKRFKLQGSLKSHEKTHTARDRPYLCHVCCKTFLSNCGLTAHMKTHADERPFTCVVCGKGFISGGQLKSHMTVHTGEAPYGCSECGRFFKRRTHLKNHVRSHLGIKLFVCGVCGKACSRQEHLTVHMRTHNGERPYQCSVCDKAFTQSHCLKTHMKSHQDQNPCLSAPTT